MIIVKFVRSKKAVNILIDRKAVNVIIVEFVKLASTVHKDINSLPPFKSIGTLSGTTQVLSRHFLTVTLVERIFGFRIELFFSLLRPGSTSPSIWHLTIASYYQRNPTQYTDAIALVP